MEEIDNVSQVYGEAIGRIIEVGRQNEDGD